MGCADAKPSNVQQIQENEEEQSILDSTQIEEVSDSVNIALYELQMVDHFDSDQLLSMALTPPHYNWENPTSGGAIHFTKDDKIGIYQFTFGPFIGYQEDSNGDTLSAISMELPDVLPHLVPAKEVIKNVHGMGYGNPTSILITSEIDPTTSTAFAAVKQELEPWGFQLYFLKEKS